MALNHAKLDKLAEAGDIEKQVAAQEAIARLAMEENRLNKNQKTSKLHR